MIRIKEQLANDQLVFIFGVGRFVDPNLIQMFGMHGGFDGLWIDIEHGNASVRDIEVACTAARSVDLETFVRLAPTDYAEVTRCLEAGTGGVMAAQIVSAEQTEEFMQWAKFYPRGRRGLNMGGYDAGFGSMTVPDFMEKANRESFVAIQIETLEALDQCDAIAAVDGVDLLFIGPSDLSQALGVPGDFLHAKCIEAIERISAACRNHGKALGAVTIGADHTDMMIDKGCRLVSPANDVRMINLGIQAAKKVFEKHIG